MQVPASRIPSHCLWGFKRFPSTEINVGILDVLREAVKNVLDFFFLIFARSFHWISGIQGFMWWELLESKWSGQEISDSEITQEWLDGRRTGCLSKAFFLTLPTISRWGSMKTQQHWKNRIEPKAQSILIRQKHPAKSFGLLVLSLFQAQRKGLRIY